MILKIEPPGGGVRPRRTADVSVFTLMSAGLDDVAQIQFATIPVSARTTLFGTPSSKTTIASRSRRVRSQRGGGLSLCP